MPLLIVGCTVIDLIFPHVPRLPAWPTHTEFTASNLVLLSEPPLVSIGGNGANAAYVAARCGARVTLHSNGGSDWLGERARGWLEEAGCRVPAAGRIERTAVNVTAANANLQRATLFYPGTPIRLPGSARGFTHALVCGWPHPAPARLAPRLRAWRRLGTRTACDVGPFLGKVPAWAEMKPVLAALDLFLSNEHELLALTGARQMDRALGRLRQEFAGDIVIKLGARGAYWIPAGESTPRHFPGHAVWARNTVGAGDTFNGALLASLERGATFPVALRAANRTAANVVRSAKGVLGLGLPRRGA